jgi:HEPN domain-containing protein
MTDARTQLAQGWLIKAHNDLTAARQLASFDNPRLDVAIYHCQQSAEKSIKAFLAYHDVDPPRTHDIENLLQMVESIDARWTAWHDTGRFLTPYATAYRYPLDPRNLMPDRADFDRALDLAGQLYAFAVSALPVNAPPA